MRRIWIWIWIRICPGWRVQCSNVPADINSIVSLCRTVLEAEVGMLLGPKTEEDLKPPEKKPKAKVPPKVWTAMLSTLIGENYVKL